MATVNVKDFPDDVYARIGELARRERRSIAQQVIVLLSRAVEHEEKRSILELRGLGRETWREVDAAQHVSNERDAWT